MIVGIISMGDELKYSAIINFLETVPNLSKILQNFSVAVAVADALCDIALLLYNRNDYEWFEHTVLLLYQLTEDKKPRDKFRKVYYCCKVMTLNFLY